MSQFSAKSGPEDQGGYREIPLSVIKVNERYDFNIYIHAKNGFRLFAAKSAPFTVQHAGALKEKDMKLFVVKGDWGRVMEYRTLHLSSILTDPEVSVTEKADIAFAASMESINRIMESTESRTVRHMEPLAEEMARLTLSEERVMRDLIRVSSHDHFTYQHSVRVGIFATALTVKLFGARLTKADLSSLSEGYFLHDVGMARVPLSILDKRGGLSPAEWRVIRMHPVWGYERLNETGQLTLESAGIVLSHHERSNGEGYPHAVAGDEIPVYAKICALADVFESLTAVRPYRNPKDTFTALRTIQQEMPHEFSQEMLRAFILMMGPGK